MSDYLETIRKVMHEHQLLHEGEIRVAESVNDVEAIFSLQRAYSSWSQSSRDALAERQKKLQETIDSLDVGLKKHFAFEEESLPPIFGETLMHALLVEHGEINDKIAEAKSALTNTRLEELTREESGQRAHIQQLIYGTNQMVDEHAGKEEVILKMIERALLQKSPLVS